ncbi:MAG: LPS export ABC transporter ATP-binding protein [Candidatus Hydrogenedentota bacterium]|nr:MAG: LPS export ABC transporter ATP-binding protein [Candidatus Hydrogenedentota bacterium]
MAQKKANGTRTSREKVKKSASQSGEAKQAKKRGLTLRVEKLKKKYKKRYVVNGVSFKITQGEVVGLLGPNGAGKTTSFYMTVGLVRPTEGKIFLGGKDISDMPMYKRARSGIGYLPQEASIFRKLTVRQNIEAILEIRGLSREKIRERTDELLEDLEIAHVQKQLGITLSGGERRRAEIARVLAGEPKFVLLDEPFAGVDPIAVKEIQKIIEKLQEKNLGILITDHNVRETLSITHRAYIMFQGRVLRHGSAEDLINDPKAREIYLGDDFKM